MTLQERGKSGDGAEYVPEMFVRVERHGFGDWRWIVHDWPIGKPWWAKPRREGSALTERGAWRKARRAARDEVRRYKSIAEAPA